MKTAGQILAEKAIDLMFSAIGNYKALCPVCSSHRKKKRDRCLSVRIDELGVQWKCHNGGCGFRRG